MQKTSVSSRYLSLVLIGLATLWLAGCASGPTIQSDYDPTADFSQYRTYGFLSPMGIETPNYSSIYGAIFRDAIAREMESRGYVLSADPDLLLNVSAQLQDKTRVMTTSDPYIGRHYYGYRRGLYDPWAGYGYGPTTQVSSYAEGTVNVDMVDRRLKRMVWEGVAVGRIDKKKSNEDRKQNIYTGIREMFAGYPFRGAQ